MPTCLVIQHVAPECAFTIEDALVAAGVAVDTRRIHAGDGLPADLRGLDGLVVMGGPMCAFSDDGFPTRPAELALVAEAAATGVPALGVCLGAQLVALACGGLVYPGQAGPEVGWSTVSLTAACATDPLFAGLPPTLPVLQWHGDTFDLPLGAVHLLHNTVYASQGFRIGDATWGLQFHLEVSEPAVEGFLRAFAADADAVPGGGARIRAATPGGLAELSPWRGMVLGRFARLVVARARAAPSNAPV